MEFNEKLQDLRKGKGLTQEELAEALFVSRTAISKWESGRGYPNLDSLKQISRYFSVSIDELICPEEIISAAKEEKQESLNKYLSLVCDALDLMLALLLFLPIFGSGAGTPGSVSLFGLTGLSPWIKAVFLAVIGLTVLSGLLGFVLSRLETPVWNHRRLVAGLALSVAGTAVFILTRQPYAGILCLAILVVKAMLIWNRRVLP